MTNRKRLSGHFADSGLNKEIAFIGGYWENNKPGGFGVLYQLHDEATCAVVADLFDGYRKHFLEADLKEKREQILLYKSQLVNHRALCEQTPGFEMFLVANIWLLESLGVIKSNDYNGVSAVFQ